MELLPDERERDRLLDDLSQLIVAAGTEPFLASPLVEPSDRCFPDPWSPDEAGVGHLLRRLLGYAGLEHLQLVLEIDRFSESHGEVGIDGRALSHRGTAAWFAGIRGRVCSFGVDSHQLRDPQGLVGTLAHEVAHAYRHAHELNVREPSIEEPLTDLTTVYLGFGILTANASQRFRSGRDGNATWWSAAEGGYLKMPAMCYLLAAQLVARGAKPATTTKALAPNQRACVKAAVKALGQRELLLERFGLPVIATAPEKRRGWLGRLFRS